MESFELLVILNEVWAYWTQASPTGSHWFPLTLSSLCALVLPSPSLIYLFFLLLTSSPSRLPTFVVYSAPTPSQIYKRNYHQRRTVRERRQRGWGGRSMDAAAAAAAEGMEWKTKRKWRRDSGVEGETDGGAEMKWKGDRAGNRGREGGVIIYQVFGCAWQRRKLISTLCVHQLHSQASQGIPLACLCEAERRHTLPLSLRIHVHGVRVKPMWKTQIWQTPSSADLREGTTCPHQYGRTAL